jgi:hypothetical protein
MVPLPTFVIVGAQKSGTSSLHRTLRDHPQLHMSSNKELHFFDRQFDRGLEWYAEQFAPEPGQTQLGETTPAYMYKPSARQHLVESLPDARIVMILRNPADRAYSHYWHDVRQKELGRRTRPVADSFEAALAEERPDLFASLVPGTEVPGVEKRDSYVGRGEYIDQIEPFIDAYGEDRVLILLLEDLVSDRTGTLRRLFRFLDVSEEPAAVIQEVHVNKHKQADEEGKMRAAAYPPMRSDTRAALTGHFRPFNERLAKLLDRDLGHWG